MASNGNGRRGFKSIKGLTKLFKSDIPMKDENKSGENKDKNVAYIAGPSTWKQWKDRAKQDAPVTNQQLYTPPTTLEFQIRKPQGQGKAPAPPPPPPPPPAAPAPAHEAALQNGYQPHSQNDAKQNKKLGKKTFRNYVFINEYHSSNQDVNGFAVSTESVSTQNSNSQYYNSHDTLPVHRNVTQPPPPPPQPKPQIQPFRKPLDLRKVKVYNVHDGAVGRKDRFKGQSKYRVRQTTNIVFLI